MEVRDLRDDERAAGNACVARALRDNPSLAVVFGPDPVARMRASYDIFAPIAQGRPPIGALIGPHVIGIAGYSLPGACLRHILPPQLITIPDEEPGGWGSTTRMQHWLGSWAARDLDEEHWHVGPVGVEPGLQGRGVGRAIMDELCTRLDNERMIGWLETDKPENVRFYTAVGFEVTEEVEVLGAMNWFMRRDPR